LLGDIAALLLLAGVVGTGQTAAWLYAANLLAILTFSKSYRPRIALSAMNDVKEVGRDVGLAFLFPVPVIVMTGAASLGGQALGSVLLLVVVRFLGYVWIRKGRRSGWMTERTIVAGAGAVGVEIANLLAEHREYGLQPVGFLDRVGDDLPFPLLGDIRDLDDVIERHAIQRLIIAYGSSRDSEAITVLRAAAVHDVEVYVVPRLFDMGVSPEGKDVEHVWGLPLYRIRRAALRTRSWALKRSFDVVVASLMLLAAAPVLAVTALVVRASGPGPVFFRQHRVGQDGRRIEVLKFRSMAVNDDSDTTWSVTGDQRQTRVGYWLRRTSIDELPQLWNVLRGDMSLVGPRPERPHFVSEFSLRIYGYGDRHRVPVGLTGWAQVHGLRGDTSIAERARFDNYYIEHWSLWRDVSILLRTLGAVFRDALGMRQPDVS